MIRLPGLIDPHVHLRTPGQTHKEDFTTSTSAALAGGYTILIDMPNNATPITSLERLEEKQAIAKEQSMSDIGFYFGSLGDNLEEFEKVKDLVYGLKLYLNVTTGGYIIDEPALNRIYEKWHEVAPEKPILLHAEEDVFDMVVRVLEETPHPTHIVHVSTKEELTRIMQLKKEGLPITCGVCPHHLFLTKDDLEKLGPYGVMKPSLKSKEDQEFLWEHLSDIDVIESDHAPHTKEEKESANPPSGVPGLETTLPLLLTTMSEGRITQEEIIRLCHTRAKEIFQLPDQPNTYVEVDENESYEIRNDDLYTKCKWTPFHGWQAKGKVKKVVLRGETVYEEGKVLIHSGEGHVIQPAEKNG